MDRNFGVGRDIKPERKLEWETSESPDRDPLRQRFASLERNRQQVQLLPLEPESKFESEFEGEEALSDSESESELDDLYEARTCQNSLAQVGFTQALHTWTASSSPIANPPISFCAASLRSRSLCFRIL